MAIQFSIDKTAIIKGIASISKRGATLDRDIGTLAASAVAHAAIHGDVTLFASLLNAMPKGSRSATLLAWVQSCAPISASYNTAKGLWSASIDKKREKQEFLGDRANWAVGTLKETHWVSFKKDSGTTEFTEAKLLKMLEQVAKGKRKNATEGVMDLAARLLIAAKIPAPAETEPA